MKARPKWTLTLIGHSGSRAKVVLWRATLMPFSILTFLRGSSSAGGRLLTVGRGCVFLNGKDLWGDIVSVCWTTQVAIFVISRLEAYSHGRCHQPPLRTLCGMECGTLFRQFRIKQRFRLQGLVRKHVANSPTVRRLPDGAH